MPSLLSRFAGRFPAYTGPYSVGTVDIELPVSSLPHNFDTPCPDSEVTTIAFRLFYPCLEPDASPKTAPANWIPTPQDGHIKEFGKFLGLGESLSSAFVHFPHLLSHIKLAAHSNAKPLRPESRKNPQWPLIVFSHGLAGNRTTYSHICSSMASHGLIVAAPEHRDGSCPVTYIGQSLNSNDGPTRKVYNKISHTPSNTVYKARDEQLRTRLWELGLLVEALTKIDDGSASENMRSPKETPESAMSWFRGLIDVHTPGKVTFAGHSFGAATTLQLVKTAYWSNHPHPILPISRTTSNTTESKEEQTNLFKPTGTAAISKLITPTTPTILLDMWTLPLRSPFTSDLAALPMPQFAPENSNGGAPLLAVMSSAFAGWQDNLDTLKSVLSDPYANSYQTAPLKHPSLAALLVQSDAASATDSGYESETASAQGVAAPSSPEPPVVRPRAKAHIFYPLRSAHLSQSDYGVLFPTLTRYVAKGSDPDRTIRLNVRAILEILRRTNIPIQGVKGKPNSDPTILSTQAESLRGWVCVNVDESTKPPSAVAAKLGNDTLVDKVVDSVAPGEVQAVAEYGGKT